MPGLHRPGAGDDTEPTEEDPVSDPTTPEPEPVEPVEPEPEPPVEPEEAAIE